MSTSRCLIAVDIGNSRMKIGRFDTRPVAPAVLPEPAESLDLPIESKTGEFNANRLIEWYDRHTAESVTFLIASVHRGAMERLSSAITNWCAPSQHEIAFRQLSHDDVPLAVHVEEPARVGIDRLLGAFAANRLRPSDRPAVVVGLGTAITVDLVGVDGAFYGGAILPGMAMSARALSEYTDALPHVRSEELDAPPRALGTSTTSAIESGLYWGAVGAIRELVSQVSKGLDRPPLLLLAGGASWQVVDAFATDADISVRHVPHLVLSGIALVHEGTAAVTRDR